MQNSPSVLKKEMGFNGKVLRAPDCKDSSELSQIFRIIQIVGWIPEENNKIGQMNKVVIFNQFISYQWHLYLQDNLITTIYQCYLKIKTRYNFLYL